MALATTRRRTQVVSNQAFRIHQQSIIPSSIHGFPASSEEPISFEDFNFDKSHAPIPNPPSRESCAIESIPQSSGMTALSSLTNDDSAMLINQRHFPTSQPTAPVEEYTLQRMTASPVFEEGNEDSAERAGGRPLPLTRRAQGRLSRSRSRNYQLFPGRNLFFCGGRFMTSTEYWAFAIALVLLIAPCVLFGVFTCPFLWYNIHPVIPILFAYLFLLTLASMIKTSWTDPGIIPRDLDPSPAMEMLDERSSSPFDSWSQAIPVQKEIQIKDITWSLKYCETCKIYRPPRASHCRQCDNCVENEDHHCIWLNNCIGKRNYRPFFAFITGATLLCLYVIAFSVTHLLLIAWQNNHGVTPSFDIVFQSAPVSFVLAILCFVLLWMVGGLTLYHCSLVLRGVTTHEKLRVAMWDVKQPETGANPYNKGNPVLNMVHVLCRPQPKSYLRRRKFVDDTHDRSLLCDST